MILASRLVEVKPSPGCALAGIGESAMPPKTSARQRRILGFVTMGSVWPICRENRAVSIIGQQRSKTSRTGKRAIQLAGSAVEGSLGLDLSFRFLSCFPAM